MMTAIIRQYNYVFDHELFAQHIKQKRVECGFTLAEIVQFTGLSDSHISTLERGIEPNPKVNNFLPLLNLYDLNVHDYFRLDV